MLRIRIRIPNTDPEGSIEYGSGPATLLYTSHLVPVFMVRIILTRTVFISLHFYTFNTQTPGFSQCKSARSAPCVEFKYLYGAVRDPDVDRD